jgi:hypothetical protein
MVASIIDSTEGGELEVRRWYDNGETYAWMVQEYQRKYGLKVSPTMFSYRRSARGWERRKARRADGLFPWVVQEEHKWHRLLVMLRLEARSRRFGLDTMPDSDVRELTTFREQLRIDDVVIHYDPHTGPGFVLVPRQASDSDIVRQPTQAGPSQRRARD